jgi:hypothetical protein
MGGCSSSTRGLFSGGFSLNNRIDVIEYITIASTGNATDFGDLLATAYAVGGTSSPTRGVFAGGSTGSNQNVIQYVTIDTTGNAADFGDLTVARAGLQGASDGHGGL